ncbi:MAG TPA: PIG-L family deacetylase [Kiritimatiellia bacterium]|nr:PIG-L family deacetylase [Kiritimatiellia bacterium]HRZ12608.1 PIG-L family deacetylase [Kiritimatiellia bacterium]HSA17686.1 PIG-L family deacetylase [Kiritimatiellia bacterium]
MAQGPYDCLYLSPHLDDAILSCAGQISLRTREGRSVLIYTAMAAEQVPSPLQANGARFLKLCGLGPDAGRVRRAEDARACARVGAKPDHGDLPEAVYRCDASGRELYPTHESLFEAIRPEDEGLMDRLARSFGALPRAAAVFAPLGAGGHVDHVLVRRAAEQVFGAGLSYYEDYPYAVCRDVVRRLTQPRRAWSTVVVKLDAGARRARAAAILEYASQWPMLFGSRAAFRWRDGWRLWLHGGERLWRRASSGS